ncbi:MAG: HAMP domain-containing protein [Deltaproteobacteria bacterium]|nr:MAG: HAMP domain-containing protein [Deltaproteobacteria bacterium]
MRLGLFGKNLLLLAGTILATGLIIITLVRIDIAELLADSNRQRGEAIARHLATAGANAVLAGDRISLKLLALDEVSGQPDLRYVIYLDGDGNVLAHTFEKGLPADLIDLHGQASEQGSEGTIPVILNGERVDDIAVTILRGGLGTVRIGLSHTPVASTIRQATADISVTLALLVLFIMLVAGLTASHLTRPIRRLAQAAAALGEGDLSQRVELSSRDELGRLGTAFNRMAESIQESTASLREQNLRLEREIDQRRRAEAALAEQRDFFQTLLDDIPVPIFYKDLKGFYLGCNRAFEEFFGKTAEKILGFNDDSIFPPDQVERHNRFDTALIARSGQHSYELPTVRADGSTRQLLYHKATFTDRHGNVAGLIGVMQDITLERETARLRNDFVSTVAHEFQTPLATIIGFAELLLEHKEACRGKEDEFVTHIYQKAQALSGQVDRLLDLSKIDRGLRLQLKRSSCDLDQLVREEVDLFARVDQSHNYELSQMPNGGQAKVDAARIRQVLEGLLDNARKYTPAGTTIRITSGRNGSGHRICVADEGPGVPAEYQDRVFDKFFRIDASDTAPAGTGLGLFIARSIVEAHGGSLDLESPGEGGTTICFTLPL